MEKGFEKNRDGDFVVRFHVSGPQSEMEALLEAKKNHDGIINTTPNFPDSIIWIWKDYVNICDLDDKDEEINRILKSACCLMDELSRCLQELQNDHKVNIGITFYNYINNDYYVNIVMDRDFIAAAARCGAEMNVLVF